MELDSEKKKCSKSKDKLLNNRVDVAAKGSSATKARKIRAVSELKKAIQ